MNNISTINIPPTEHLRVLENGIGWVGLIDVMGNEAKIVNAARVSFGKMKSEMDDNDIKLLKYLIKNKHLSPLEHVVLTFSIHCPLYVRSQWMRHRTWSYNEISRRYTKDELEFYVPENFRMQSESNRQASTKDVCIDSEFFHKQFDAMVDNCLCLYNNMIDAGICKEMARGVLPQSMMTTFWGTVDLRNLLGFLELRLGEGAQSEIVEYAKAIYKLTRDRFPNVFEEFKNTINIGE